MSEQVAALANPLFERMQDCWLRGDSGNFAENFGADADFVDVLGRITKGRTAIARVHRNNFDTIHLNSRLRLELVRGRMLTDSLALAHVEAWLNVPAGPLAGETAGVQTWLLERTGSEWLISAFHNTHVREMAGVPPLDAGNTGPTSQHS
jgi:uncharacterized protein (TIGR02246 family)